MPPTPIIVRMVILDKIEVNTSQEFSAGGGIGSWLTKSHKIQCIYGTQINIFPISATNVNTYKQTCSNMNSKITLVNQLSSFSLIRHLRKQKM